MSKTAQEVMESLQKRQAIMQAVVNLRAQNLSWQAIADSVGLNSRQWAQQLWKQAQKEGLTPQEMAA